MCRNAGLETPRLIPLEPMPEARWWRENLLRVMKRLPEGRDSNERSLDADTGEGSVIWPLALYTAFLEQLH